ncbi:nucleoside 2-deoxyribosyltransferase [Variovorax sp. HJSM1_2]|uniref:nucleoside 2-deoxyribosyltransferase n=1 Tax=Variovorax sp. HJSM1_2 TaxID=3366263 RepID=UPI003BD533D7
MPQQPSHPPRIYLAGPDVFFPECDALYTRLKTLCSLLGMVGVAPTDSEAAKGFSGSEDALAQRIYEGNVALIEQADGVAANLVAFRGLEPDSGTVFEVGYAIALRKPVVAYGVPAVSYAQRVAATLDCAPDASGTLRETATGTMVEGLGQRLNLMLSRSAHLAPSAEAALGKLAELLLPKAS